MGMNLRTDASIANRFQLLQHAAPIVEVKSYDERHSKSLVGLVTEVKQESNTSFQTSHSNTPRNSYGSLTEEKATSYLSINPNSKIVTAQTPSPNSSPQTPQLQWNFEQTMNSEYPLLIARLAASDNLKQAEKCVGESSTINQPLEIAQNAFLQNANNMSATQMQCLERSPNMCISASDVCANDSAKENFKVLNDIFAKRIEDIDAKAWGDKDLKIFNYQEWVEFLLKVNESFLTDMEELEREVANRLELVQKRVNSNCRHSQGNELMKCRKDIDTLLKYIKNKNLDPRCLTLETLTPEQILYTYEFDNCTNEYDGGDEIKSYNAGDIVQRNKLYANMKALAQEVAEKHDEVRELKRQVICLEDEIQKAQKKIQLKDDVIKELRNDLKCTNTKVSSNLPLNSSPSMPPINTENQSSRSGLTDNTSTFQGDNDSQFDLFSCSEQEEKQKIKILHNEISELFELSNNVDKQKAEHHHKKIMEIIGSQQLLKESEMTAASRKLDFIRQQLINLENETSEGKSDCDSGFYSKSENDQDVKLLDVVRQRLRKRNETICDLKVKVQKLELEKNELSSKLEAEKSFFARSSDILKEVADLLCDLNGKQISYIEMYNTIPSQTNPFCEAILEMQNDFKEKEAHLLQNIDARNKQNEELNKCLIKNKTDAYHERSIHANQTDIEDIDKTSSALLSCTLSRLPSTLATTVTKSSPLPTIAQQSDNKTVTSLLR